MKKLIVVSLALVLCLCLCSCKSSEYNKALELYAAEEYQQAKTTFASLGAYENAEEMVKKCDYQMAMKLMKEEKYVEAMELLLAVGDYEDSQEQMVTCICEAAVAYAEKGNITEAVSLLTDYYQYPRAQAAFVEIIMAEITENYLPHVEAATNSWSEYLNVWVKLFLEEGKKTAVGQSVNIPKVDNNAPQVIALKRSMEKANKTMALLRSAYNEEVLKVCDEEISNLVNTIFSSGEVIDKQFQSLDNWAATFLFYGIQSNNAIKANNNLINAIYAIEDAVELLTDTRA